MFLETEAAFPYCNWSIKMARIIWFGSKSVDIGPAYVEVSLSAFFSLCKSRKFLKTKKYSYVSIKKKNICKKKFK